MIDLGARNGASRERAWKRKSPKIQLKKGFGEDQLEHGIAEKFQSLVAGTGLGMVRQIGSVGQRGSAELLVGGLIMMAFVPEGVGP